MEIETTHSVHFENDWYALRIRYQHEAAAAALLALKDFRFFLPTYQTVRRWKDRKKLLSQPLFPGYLFVEDASDRKLQILNTPGVCSIISVAGTPAVIANDEFACIRRAVESTYPVGPHPFLNEGDTVQVRSGPLAGMEGILVRRKDTCRLVISVQMLGRSAAVEIDSSECRESATQPTVSSRFRAPRGSRLLG